MVIIEEMEWKDRIGRSLATTLEAVLRVLKLVAWTIMLWGVWNLVCYMNSRSLVPIAVLSWGSLIELIKVIAWPAVASLVVVAFKPELGDLMKRLELGKAFGMEYKFRAREFERELQETRELGERAQPSPTEPLAVDPQIQKGWLQIKLEDNPRLAIQHAWFVVEQALQSVPLDDSQKTTKIPYLALKSAIDRLIEFDLLSDAARQTYDGLRHLKNQAAHDGKFDISVEQASQYGETAFKLAAQIYSAASKLKRLDA